MPLTLLLDLDDTLIRNDINTFLPAYLGMLSKHLEHRHPGDQMVRELLTATRGMLKNNDPSASLEQAFDRAFYPALQTTKENLRAEMESFYAEVYPGLAGLTGAQKQGVALVEAAFARGYQVVVATNPLFPRTAIEQRLTWGGLSPQKYPFALITSYENMHFAKPNPAYLAEILAQLGWPNNPVAMVGNSLTDDIEPARQLGFAAYHYVEGATWNFSADGAASGDLDGVLSWLERIEPTSFNLPRTPEALIAGLRATPAALGTLTRALAPQGWQFQPAHGEWSITEIIAHLRDVEREVNLPRLENIVKTENPFLPGVNSDPWAAERGYAQQDGPTALRDFTTARAGVLTLLENLPPAGWQRLARHAIFGPSQLLDLVEINLTHDRNHLQQIVANLRVLPSSVATQTPGKAL